MGIFNKVKNFAVSTTQSVKNKIDNSKQLKEAFKSDYRYNEFSIHKIDEKKNMITGLITQKHGGLLDLENKKIFLDKDLKMDANTYLQDEKNNKYYLVRVETKPFIYQIDGNDEKKELTIIGYTDKEPEKKIAPNVTYITNNDNSTNFIKNKGNVNSDNASFEKTTEVNTEINANMIKK